MTLEQHQQQPANRLPSRPSGAQSAASKQAQARSQSQQVWQSMENLFWDHLEEVENKWTTLKVNDDIWAKLIYFEQNKRLAKAYVSAPTLTIDGSTNGLGGFRIGLSGIDNPSRQLSSISCLRSVGYGVELRIDDEGNILIAKQLPPPSSGRQDGLLQQACRCSVWIKDWTATSEIFDNNYSDDDDGAVAQQAMRELKEPGQAYKLFDMRKFCLQLDTFRTAGVAATGDTKAARHRPSLDWRQCVSIVAFKPAAAAAGESREQPQVGANKLLENPCWLMVINIIAIDMLKCQLASDSLRASLSCARLASASPGPKFGLAVASSTASPSQSGQRNSKAWRPKLHHQSVDALAMKQPERNNQRHQPQAQQHKSLKQLQRQTKLPRPVAPLADYASSRLLRNLQQPSEPRQQLSLLSSNQSIYATFTGQHQQIGLGDVAPATGHSRTKLIPRPRSGGRGQHLSMSSCDLFATSSARLVVAANQNNNNNNNNSTTDRLFDFTKIRSAIRMNYDEKDDQASDGDLPQPPTDRANNNNNNNNNSKQTQPPDEPAKTTGASKKNSVDYSSQESTSSSGCADNDYFISNSSSSISNSSASNSQLMFGQSSVKTTSQQQQVSPGKSSSSGSSSRSRSGKQFVDKTTNKRAAEAKSHNSKLRLIKSNSTASSSDDSNLANCCLDASESSSLQNTDHDKTVVQLDSPLETKRRAMRAYRLKTIGTELVEKYRANHGAQQQPCGCPTGAGKLHQADSNAGDCNCSDLAQIGCQVDVNATICSGRDTSQVSSCCSRQQQVALACGCEMPAQLVVACCATTTAAAAASNPFDCNGKTQSARFASDACRSCARDDGDAKEDIYGLTSLSARAVAAADRQQVQARRQSKAKLQLAPTTARAHRQPQRQAQQQQQQQLQQVRRSGSKQRPGGQQCVNLSPAGSDNNYDDIFKCDTTSGEPLPTTTTTTFDSVCPFALDSSSGETYRLARRCPSESPMRQRDNNNHQPQLQPQPDQQQQPQLRASKAHWLERKKYGKLLAKLNPFHHHHQQQNHSASSGNVHC